MMALRLALGVLLCATSVEHVVGNNRQQPPAPDVSAREHFEPRVTSAAAAAGAAVGASSGSSAGASSGSVCDATKLAGNNWVSSWWRSAAPTKSDPYVYIFAAQNATHFTVTSKSKHPGWYVHLQLHCAPNSLPCLIN
jgi:hypothetical protein